jgi:hypothetical protein
MQAIVTPSEGGSVAVMNTAPDLDAYVKWVNPSCHSLVRAQRTITAGAPRYLSLHTVPVRCFTESADEPKIMINDT